MIRYLKQLYFASRDLSVPTRLILIGICAMPSLALAPLIFRLARLASVTGAEVDMYLLAKGSISPEKLPELNRLTEVMFTQSVEVQPLVLTVIGAAYVGAFCMAFLALPGIIAAVQKILRFRA
ncbi:hypothetical protein H8F21_14855 [Pseudomonas sp. P66]|uniref:Uncharacterized protein n=1 Tax=Pseudomonas arcuscaelestis TaxID=2710591 RepID=A0ABS2BYZ7_9PSED|nr:hypothetical protein [Pseudomonas arcuscaelestis]MBM5458846.1 hypothetical protein [Pseudomonas arcuscaelestis]